MRELIIAALASAACGAGHGTSTTGIPDKGGGGPGPMSAPGGGGGIGSPGSGGTAVPGQLTAGDRDDNLNFEFFKLYLAEARKADSQLFELAVADRIVVHAKDAAGLPLADAEVRAGSFGTRTGSDGRALLFPTHDGLAATPKVTITAQARAPPAPRPARS